MIKDRRYDMLRIHAVCEARQVVKASLRGQKPSLFASAEISRMALRHSQEHWPEFRALALAKIMASPALKAEWDREGQRYAALMARRNRPICLLPLA
jgi:hypothetical protein